ncbi:hypothetical protein [Brevibacillus massiliensis]|uniref:hypothetical protein n=1 Tax=Brevibacillus massiliensis TaxID=1118054 RepID=UPI00164D6E94|nr:hypothetical protein [Brevibacillus massiliensis]
MKETVAVNGSGDAFSRVAMTCFARATKKKPLTNPRVAPVRRCEDPVKKISLITLIFFRRANGTELLAVSDNSHFDFHPVFYWF